MNRPDPSPPRVYLVALLLVAGFSAGCGSGATTASGGSGGGGAIAMASGGAPSAGQATGGAPGSGGAGTGGNLGTGGAPGSGGIAGIGGRSTGGSGGSSGSGGATTGTGGRSSAGTGGNGTGGSGPGNCNLPATVSFQRDVQPFLITNCGGGNGCHVIDAVSTVSAGGFNHAYDWLTGAAHTSSCPTNNPMRFQIVIDVINGANPPSCSKSRRMPPPDATGAGLRAPLTACQVATLQAWLNEPLVTQMHRLDNLSPTTPYPMPPFN